MDEVKKVEMDFNEGNYNGQQLTEEQKKLQATLFSADSRTKLYREKYAKLLERNPHANCPACGGIPEGNRICPVCEQGSATEKIALKEEVDIEQTSELFIPNNYVGVVFNPDKIRESHNSLTGVKEFEDYLMMLTRITNQLNSKMLQLSSLFIHAPSGFGKDHFAYSLLQIALTNGMTVFPYLDLSEVSRLMTAHENKYNRRIRKDPIIDEIGFSDVDLVTAQVCVLKVPHDNNIESFKVALKVIDRRARRGLPTIILSRYNYKYFTAFDSYGEVDSIVKYDSVSPKNIRRVEMSARLNNIFPKE